MPQELITLSEGTTIQGQNGDRFVIKRLLATGGFGSVYLVHDRRVSSKLYVLKELRDPDGYERQHLNFEGAILKRLKHPALPHVYQVFEDTRLKRIYMLMDYVKGSDLETLRMGQPEQRFALSETLTFMRPVIEAVAYLHRQQPPVVHRDIKPANIIVSPESGEVKLVDFGLAKEYVEEKTTSVFRYGTSGYAAVEQYTQGTNPRTDIYALAATIYVLLSGVIPVDALLRNLEQYDEDPLLPLYMLNQAIPVPVSDVIEKAMSLRSKDRYATVEEFWQALCLAAGWYPRTEPITANAQLSSELPKPRIYTFVAQTDKPDGSVKAPHVQFPQGQVYPAKKRLRNPLYALLACLILGGLIASFFFYTAWSGQKTVTPEAACIAEDLTPVTGNTPSDFPALAACYAGTVSILGISTSKTNLFLFHIQQSQGLITGDCNGFGAIGTFSGEVTKSSRISFTIQLQNQERPLRFEGVIAGAGEIVLSYSDLDQDGHAVNNEYGAGRLKAYTALDLTPTVPEAVHAGKRLQTLMI